MSKLGAADGEREARKPSAQHTYIPPTGSPRNPIPEAVVYVLGTLLEALPEAPSSTRVELRSIRARIARLYKIPLTANATELAWENEDDAQIPE